MPRKAILKTTHGLKVSETPKTSPKVTIIFSGIEGRTIYRKILKASNIRKTTTANIVKMIIKKYYQDKGENKK